MFAVLIVMMKKFNSLLALCFTAPLLAQADGLLAVDNPAKNGAERSAYASAEAFAANDQLAMRQYGGDWQGSYSPRNGTNLGLLAVRAETGVQWQGYRLGALYRAEALVEASRDASDLVRQFNTRSGYDAGRSYPLDYRVRGFEADGARLGKSFALTRGGPWQVDGGVALSYLHGQRLKLETVTGQVVTLNAKDINADARQDNSDSRLNVRDLTDFNAPYGRLATPSGQGYALDLGLLLRHGDSGTSIELAVSDLVGRMDWKNLPSNVADYNTATKYYDANGYVHLNPTATRTSSYRDLSQTLEPKWRLAASYPIGNFELQGAANYTSGYWFPQIGASYRITPQWRIGADYDARFNSVGVTLQHPWLYFGLRMEGANLDTAKAYGLQGGISIQF